MKHSRQSGGRRRAMRHRLIVLAPASQLLFPRPMPVRWSCGALVVGAGSGGSMLEPGVGAVAWSGSGGACVSSPPAVGCCSRQPSPYGVEKGGGGAATGAGAAGRLVGAAHTHTPAHTATHTRTKQRGKPQKAQKATNHNANCLAYLKYLVLSSAFPAAAAGAVAPPAWTNPSPLALWRKE